MKVLSLFSGIGGFDLGFERAGMEIVGMCEIDKHAQKILKRHFPNATLHTDVKEVHYERGTVDVICGGFPCQDISVAGKRRGLDGERSGLWFEFARIIDEAQPKWVVIENVPGLFSSDNGRDLATIIQWLANRGYGVGWRVLDSQGFGLAQRRKRVFIVASFGTPSGCTLLLEPESVRWDTTSRRSAKQSNTGAVAKCLMGHGQRIDYESETIIPFSFKMRVTGGNASGVRGGKNTRSGGQGYLESDKAFTIATTHDQFIAIPDVSPALRAEQKQSLMSGSGNINVPLAISSKPERVLWESSHGYDPARVMSNQDIVPTLSAKMGTGGNNVPNVGVRRLTPIECERLQGFPDNWTSEQADTHRYKQLGNAVSVPVAHWIGNKIMEAQNGE